MTKDSIPIEALSQHVGIIGKTGTGKSFTARGLVERLLDEGRRVCVVDPTGVWSGLKSNAKGTGPGYPVAIFGGDRADVPLTVGAAKALGKIIAERNLPAVIDVSDFNMTERYQFGEAFFRSLHASNRAPLHLILDEADEFARQQPLPEARRVLHEVDRIVRRGRVRGFRVVFITQRPAVLHKNVLTQANALIAMRLTSPQDRKAFDEWIKGQADEAQGREVAASLSSLKRGEGWVWAPELGILQRTAFPPIKTFDSMRAPGDGESVVEPVNLADVDLSEIRDAFADAEAEAKANDPRELRRQIADLQRQLKAAQNITGNITDTAQIEAAAERRGYERGFNDSIAKGCEAFSDMAKALSGPMQSAIESLTDAHSELYEIEMRLEGLKSAQPAADPVPVGSRSVERRLAHTMPSAKPTPSAQVNGALERPLQRIIDSIRWWNVLGVAAPSHSQVAFVANYSHKSGTWATYLSRLRSMGLIEGRGDLVLTAEGAAVVNEPETPPSGEHLRSTVLTKIDGPLARILSPIIDAWPSGLTHAAAGASAGYSPSSGTWATYLSRLRSLDLIEGRGELKAQNWLFP